MKTSNHSSLANTKRVLTAVTTAALCILGWGFWHNQQPTQAKHLDRANPWRGFPGCLWVGEGDQQRLWPVTKGDIKSCGLETGRTPQVLDEADVPAHSHALLNSLQPWLAAPPNANPTALTAGVGTPQFSYRIKAIGKRPVQQGHSLHLTLDLAAQRHAQLAANCMTGKLDDCAAAGIPANRWQHHFDGAGARMAALVQIDLQTGGIDAVVSAFSPCYEFDAKGRPETLEHAARHCPKLAHAGNKSESWRLENQGIYAYDRLGSLVKPLEAVTLLSNTNDPFYSSAKGQAWLNNVFKTSDTQALLDALYCKDEGFKADCKLLKNITDYAEDLALGGQTMQPMLGNSLGFELPGARALTELVSDGSGKKVWQPMHMVATSPALRAECSARGYRKCESQALAEQVAELLGEGSTSGSPLGIAHMLNVLGSAANGSIENTGAAMRTPRLAHKLVTGGNRRAEEDLLPPGIDSDVAYRITQAMQLSNTAGGTAPGTAHSACLAAYGDAKTCNGISTVAGKTGTPGFRHKLLNIAQRDQLCTGANAKQAQAKAHGEPLRPATVASLASCTHAPVKWYAALVKESLLHNSPYTKAVVVLAERNWVRATGIVDSPEDRGTPNIAAEMAMRYFSSSGLVSGLPSFKAKKGGKP